MNYKKKIRYSVGASLLAASAVFAVALTDIEIDAEGQNVLSLYGNQCIGEVCTTEYSSTVLKLPEEVLCLVRQVWKPELLGQGNVHVEINDKKCVGNEEGRDKIAGVFNIGIDPQSGQTVGKLWLSEENSKLHDGKSVVSYIKIAVESTSTVSEPYGRFRLDMVEEDQGNKQVLLAVRVTASGASFQAMGRAQAFEFNGYVDGVSRKGIYTATGKPRTAVGFNDTNICFQKTGFAEACFPRQLAASETNPHVKVNAWNYGIYNPDGTRFDGSSANLLLQVDADRYEIVDGFGGHIRNFEPSKYGARPGRDVIGGSDGVFWTNKNVSLIVDPADRSKDISKKIQWLTKTHSVHPDGAKNLSNIDSSGISLDASPSLLGDITELNSDNAKAIGVIPVEVLKSPIKVKAGRVL